MRPWREGVEADALFAFFGAGTGGSGGFLRRHDDSSERGGPFSISFLAVRLSGYRACENGFVEGVGVRGENIVRKFVIRVFVRLSEREFQGPEAAFVGWGWGRPELCSGGPTGGSVRGPGGPPYVGDYLGMWGGRRRIGGEFQGPEAAFVGWGWGAARALLGWTDRGVGPRAGGPAVRGGLLGDVGRTPANRGEFQGPEAAFSGLGWGAARALLGWTDRGVGPRAGGPAVRGGGILGDVGADAGESGGNSRGGGGI